MASEIVKVETPRLHQSTATVLINKSPLHAWYKQFGGAVEEYDENRNLGSLCHALLLGGEDIVEVAAKDWRTNAAKEERDAAIAAGKIPVLSHKLAEAEALADKVRVFLAKKTIILGGESEMSVKWETPGGVACEGRLDHFQLYSGMIYDFKFCASAAKRVCENKFIEFGYDIQHAAYVQAIETLYPELAGKVSMEFIFVETEPPHAIRIMPVAGTMRTSGQWRWARACEIWSECLESFGTETPWPAYEDDGEAAECPAWALNAQLVQEEIHQREVAQ